MKLCKLLFRVSLFASVLFLAAEVMAEDLYLAQPLVSGVYRSDGAIIAQDNCLVESSHQVLLLAGQQIVLKAGFHATAGSDFKAMIGDYTDIPQDLDADCDGLPDWWEVRYFSDTLNSGSSNDTDGDGVMDSVEFKLGANPAENDLPGPGLHYEYDALGRINRIYRIPVH